MDILQSTTEVRQRFQEEYDRPPPMHITIRRIHAKFRRHGYLQHAKYPHQRETTDERNQNRVLAYFEENPTTSLRQACSALDITYYAVQRILKDVRLKAFRLTPLHGLFPADLQRRVAACQIFAQMVEMDPEVLHRMFFSDEAGFHVDGRVNTSSCRIWAFENPHAGREFQRDSPKVNVWCGVTARHVVGPFFFMEPTVTHNNYLDMLVNYVIPILEDLDIVQNGYFMQDGAPPHWAFVVRDYLTEVFHMRWIGRGGPLPWPARSPDLTPCDFAVWGIVKDHVYRTPVRDIPDLRDRIEAAFHLFDEALLSRIFNTMVDRWHRCIETGGIQVEGVPYPN